MKGSSRNDSEPSQYNAVQPNTGVAKHASDTGECPAKRPAESYAPQRKRIRHPPRRQLVDVGGRERQQYAEADAGQHPQDAERQKRVRGRRSQQGEDAGDPQAPEQGAAAAEPVGDDAVDRSADQETDEAAGDQQSRLAGLQAPWLCDIMNDVSRIERVIAVKQGEQPHDGAEAPVKFADLCLG
jgi:hypothetical protein